MKGFIIITKPWAIAIAVVALSVGGYLVTEVIKNSSMEVRSPQSGAAAVIQADSVSDWTPVTTTEPTPQIKTRFYIKYNNSRLRTCPSTTCDVKGYFSRGGYLDLNRATAATLNDLEEWLTVTEPDGSIGYLNKSVLSETPIKEITNTNILNETDKNAIHEWNISINQKHQANLDMLYAVSQKGLSNVATDVVDTIEMFDENLNTLRNQLAAAVAANKMDLIIQVTTRLQKLYDDFDADLPSAMNKSLQNRTSSIESVRIQAVNDAYRRMEAEQQAINQSRIDATNAYIEQYNAIRSEASGRGIPESIVQSQLNAAGFGGKINCYFSSVGGMTPGSGSMTCY